MMAWLPDPAVIAAAFDHRVDRGLVWVIRNWKSFFDGLRGFLASLYYGLEWVLSAPWYVIAVVAGLLGWRIVGRGFGIASSLGLAGCWLMGLWPETMSTLALVFAATALALIVALPLGVLAGYLSGLERVIEPVLDLVQTMPPYIYLLPAIALLGFGPATALAATLIVAVPPAIRLTALGIRRTPTAFLELGQASGMTGWQLFIKVRVPFAAASVMAGVNQSLMMAFGMVVIAGIVGSGGLGETIYKAIRMLDIGKSIDAAIAIVVLTIILDRMTQALARPKRAAA